jgi:hypothetical protein
VDFQACLERKVWRVSKACQSLVHLDPRVTSVLLDARENVEDKVNVVWMDFKDRPGIQARRATVVNLGKIFPSKTFESKRNESKCVTDCLAHLAWLDWRETLDPKDLKACLDPWADPAWTEFPETMAWREKLEALEWSACPVLRVIAVILETKDQKATKVSREHLAWEDCQELKDSLVS